MGPFLIVLRMMTLGVLELKKLWMNVLTLILMIADRVKELEWFAVNHNFVTDNLNWKIS